MLDRPKNRDRYRAYRQRQRDGLACTQVVFDGAIIELLVATRWLSEADSIDRRKVGLAIGRMLAASAKARRV
jgi:hypothetical protein